MILSWVKRHAFGVALAVAMASVSAAAVAVHRWLDAREAAAVQAAMAAVEIGRLRAEIAQRAEAAAVARAHASRLEQLAADRAARIQTLTRMEGLDAPLPDPLRDAGRVLWP